jgi:hypothetical protein
MMILFSLFCLCNNGSAFVSRIFLTTTTMGGAMPAHGVTRRSSTGLCQKERQMGSHLPESFLLPIRNKSNNDGMS